MIRILTYNVHSCVGVDRRLDVDRIATVIAAESPDIVALQEVDVGRARTGGVDQARAIASLLGMRRRFHAAVTVGAELYGVAILTAWPERLIKAAALPGHPFLTGLEPRGALWVTIDVAGAPLQVLTTHLGLAPREQRLQARALAGPEWLGGPDRHGPLILLGDLNAGGQSATCRPLLNRLNDATRRPGGARGVATFPSVLPFRQIDHIFVNAAVTVLGAYAPATPLTRRASDHLPLVMDFELS
jgi:endonuclease/exonuclease/phosphatase family metal-dependent hydrolase